MLEERPHGSRTVMSARAVHFGASGIAAPVSNSAWAVYVKSPGSPPAALMRTVDRLRSSRRYANRSEFVRDLCRAELVKKEWRQQAGETVGVLVLVYDHDTRALADKLPDIQHDSHDMITSA